VPPEEVILEPVVLRWRRKDGPRLFAGGGMDFILQLGINSGYAVYSCRLLKVVA
jgi:hypothetical protein